MSLTSLSHYFLSKDRSNNQDRAGERGGGAPSGLDPGRREEGEPSPLKVSVRGWAESNTYYGCLDFDLPLVDAMLLCLSCSMSLCICLCHCVPAYATVPKYICFSGSCQSMATFFCTPTVACGTVIFVNATLVKFRKSSKQSRPNKHRHGWFRVFFTLFSVHG